MKRVAIVAGPLLVLAFAVSWLLRPSGAPDLDAALAFTVAEVIEVSAPASVSAGEGFEVLAEGVEPDVVVVATVETGYGLRRFEVLPTETAVTIEVPAVDDPASGVTVVSVTQGSLVGSTTLNIEPGPPVGPIDVYLGPRTVVADANHFVMIVAVPEDQFGNPVADGSPVDFTTIRPDQVSEAQRFRTGGLLAWHEVASQTVTGRTRVSTESGSAGAPERTFLEVAGTPEPYELELLESASLDSLAPADGQSLITVGTEVLTDQFGNLMPDGAAVVLDASGVSGVRRLHGQTIDGRAEFSFEAPDRPGRVTLMATASGVSSEPLTLDFASAVESLVAEVEFVEGGSLVHVGPVRSVRGSFVPEGSTATVTAADGAVRLVDLSLGVGTATFAPSVELEPVTVEVLGTTITVGDRP